MVKKKNSIEQTTLKKNTTVYIIKQIKILLLRSSILGKIDFFRHRYASWTLKKSNHLQLPFIFFANVYKEGGISILQKSLVR